MPGPVYSQPVVAGSNVVAYVNQTGLYALDVSRGELVWEDAWEADDVWLTAVDDMIYASGDSQLRAIDAATGEIRWTYPTGPIYYSVPAVADGIVYVGDWGGRFHAVSRQTGELLWQYEADRGFRSAPVVADGAVYIFSTGGTLHALEATTGELIWQFDVADTYYKSPAASADMAYVSSDSAMLAFDADTGELLWLSEETGASDSKMTIAMGALYVFGVGVVALDALTGELLWRYQGEDYFSRARGGPGAGSGAAPAVKDGTAYLAWEDGLHAVDAATGELLWRYSGIPPTTAPAVAKGIVFYGAIDDHVYALTIAADVPDPDPTPTPTPVSGVVRLTPDGEGLIGVFGYAVAASSDGSVIAVGDPARETEGKYRGTVSVFTRKGEQWPDRESSAVILKSPDENDWEPVPTDRDWVELASSFGGAVAMSADGGVLVVGAPEQLPYGYDSGAAYVFTRPEGGWGSGVPEVATLTASVGAPNDRFGDAVAVSVDGRTIAIGSNQSTESHWYGKIYVFVRQGPEWSDAHETAQLTPSGIGGITSVALGANGTIIVAGQPEDFGAPEQPDSYVGSVYVFERLGPQWEDAQDTARLSLPDGLEEDYFGFSAAVTDDANLVAVGAPGRDAYAQDHGAVYLFAKPATGWADASEPFALTASDGARGDAFGASVSLSANGDHVIVGAQKVNFDSSPGAAYLFAMPEDGWGDSNEAVKLTNPGGAGLLTVLGGGVFGRETEMVGETVIVGAPGEAVYLFDISSTLPRGR